MFGRGLGLGLLRGRGRVFWMCVRVCLLRGVVSEELQSLTPRRLWTL